MMKDCEEKVSLGMKNLNATVNATLQNMNTSAMSLDQKDLLIRNTTKTVIDALPKCDIEKFLTEVGTYVYIYLLHS
jgi:hypothetical protein